MQHQSEDLTIINNCDIGEGTSIAEFTVLEDCEIGDDVSIWRFANLYGCHVGDDSMIGTYVEMQEDAFIGRRCWIQSHSFVCSLVMIEDDVFVGHGVQFTNDRHPPTESKDEWEETVVHEGASIGTGAVLLPVEIGENALVGAGSVVTEDVPPNAIVVGNPAHIVGYRDEL